MLAAKTGVFAVRMIHGNFYNVLLFTGGKKSALVKTRRTFFPDAVVVRPFRSHSLFLSHMQRALFEK